MLRLLINRNDYAAAKWRIRNLMGKLAFSRGRKAASIALAILGGVSALSAGYAREAGVPLLESLQKGVWELRYRDGSPARRICVQTGLELVHLRHRGPDCGKSVVDGGPEQVTIQYSCKGNGYGRTKVRRETSTLVQIDSQGIAGERPFQFTAEARHLGPC